MLRKFRDDMGREVALSGPPKRIVSLVPSETETLFALGLGDRVVGRTTYCVEPADKVDDIAVVGGTKNVDVDSVCALEPDIVFANQEENARGPLEALAAKGVRVFVSFPQRVAEGIALVARIARVCAIDSDDAAKALVSRGYLAVRAAEERLKAKPAEISVFVPIWKDPLMTISELTFGSDMLRLAGMSNVFGDRRRQYPLKADLGLRSPLAADRIASRDVRYPRISEAELAGRAPDAVLLPDEPYVFTDEDAAEFAAGPGAPAAVHIDGKDLFWYGARIPEALERLTDIGGGLSRKGKTGPS